MSSKQVIVLAAASTLDRLARESRIARLAGLSAAEADFELGGGVVGLDVGRIASLSRRYLSGGSEVEIDALAREIARLFPEPRPGTAQPRVLVVLVVGRNASLRANMRDLMDLLAAARRLASHRALENPSWQLVTVCENELGSDEHTQLEELRRLRCLDQPDRESWLLGRCLLADWRLSDATPGRPVFTRHVWPILVGRLVVRLAVQPSDPLRRSASDCWYYAWTSCVVAAPMSDPLYEDNLLALMNSALESIPIGGNPARRTMQRWVQPAIRFDRCPASTVDEPEGESGYFKGSAGAALEDFVRSGVGAAAGSWAKRCDPDSEGWKGVQELRSVQFRIDQDRFQCAPFGSSGRPDHIEEKMWSEAHRERGLLDEYAGSQSLERVDLRAQMQRTHEVWEAILDFERLVAEGAERSRQLAELHDALRGGLLAWRFRVLIAAVVALFVGFTTTALVSALHGSLAMGAFVASGVAGLSAVGATIYLWIVELRAGKRGLECMEVGLANAEEAVAESLELRLCLLFEASSMRSKSIWMSSSARVRLLARRARQILEMIRAEVFVSSRSIVERGGFDGLSSLEAFVSDSEQAFECEGGGGTRAFVDSIDSLQRQEPNSELRNVIDAKRLEFAIKWTELCGEEDPARAGRLSVKGMRRDLQPLLVSIRSEIEQVCAYQLLKNFPGVESQVEGRVRELSRDRESPALLSVRLPGYAASELPCWDVLLASGGQLGQLEGVALTEALELPRWGGLALLAHIEFPLAFTADGKLCRGTYASQTGERQADLGGEQ
jgi:hypothetical protein